MAGVIATIARFERYRLPLAIASSSPPRLIVTLWGRIPAWLVLRRKDLPARLCIVVIWPVTVLGPGGARVCESVDFVERDTPGIGINHAAAGAWGMRLEAAWAEENLYTLVAE